MTGPSLSAAPASAPVPASPRAGVEAGTGRAGDGDVMLELRGAALSYGARTLWSGLDLDVRRGEFVAVLGPNGSGKTSLLRALLGAARLSAGTVRVGGLPPERGGRLVGYIPQQRAIDPHTPLRARDLVRLGVDGHRWGLPFGGRRVRRRVDELLAAVGATAYADAPLGLLSGGEQQRLRVAQALAADPDLLLCDEPLLSLDLGHQRAVAALVDERRRAHGTAVLFVTHEINPILHLVDRVLYLAGGRFRIGPPDEVLTSEVLTDLYGSPVEVIRAHGRIVVVVAPPEEPHHETRHEACHGPHHESRHEPDHESHHGPRHESHHGPHHESHHESHHGPRHEAHYESHHETRHETCHVSQAAAPCGTHGDQNGQGPDGREAA